MCLIASSSLHSRGRQRLYQDRNSALSRTHRILDCVPSSSSFLFSSSEQRCSRCLQILSNNEPRLSKKHWIRGSFPGCQSQKYASLPVSLGNCSFVPELASFLTSFVTLRRFLAEILSPTVPHVHIDCTSFSVSLLPLAHGISSLRMSPSISTFFQTLDEVSLFKFLVVFVSTQSPAPLGLRHRPE